jgi:hypothetical protein
MASIKLSTLKKYAELKGSKLLVNYEYSKEDRMSIRFDKIEESKFIPQKIFIGIEYTNFRYLWFQFFITDICNVNADESFIKPEEFLNHEKVDSNTWLYFNQWYNATTGKITKGSSHAFKAVMNIEDKVKTEIEVTTV